MLFLQIWEDAMNIIQIFEHFPTEESCIQHLENVRWPDGVLCPYCQSKHNNNFQHRHYCYNCKTAFSVTVRTIFHHTHLPLQKWFLAISLILNAKKGISALQLSRDIQVNKNTAWRIAMQIRDAMNQIEQRELLTGVIEMDECYLGGKPRKGKKYDNDDDKPKRGRGTTKAPVIGVVERKENGKVTAKAVTKDRLKGKNLRAFVKERVCLPNSRLMTDEYKAYNGMSRLLPHKVIKHAVSYVDGDVHTNTIESFLALLKRGMFGQFHSVSRRHLQRYIDEFCYRYNNRANKEVFGLTINRALRV
jgi:transposase-like protein